MDSHSRIQELLLLITMTVLFPSLGLAREASEIPKVITTLTGHEETILGLAFSPRDTILVSGDHKGHVFIWDWKTGKTQQRLKLSEKGITHISFSPDGQHFAAAGNGPEVNINHVDSGKKVAHHELGSGSGTSSFVFGGIESPVLILDNRGSLTIWDCKEDNSVVWDKHRLRPVAALAPNGKTIVTAWPVQRSDNTEVLLLDIENGHSLMVFSRGVSHWPAYQFSMDSTRFALWGRERGKKQPSIRILNAKTGIV